MTDRDGVKIGVERAKEIFCQYHGNRFYMDHDGVGAEYEEYHVSGETERIWTRELVSELLKSEYRGKEALRVYRAAADLSVPVRGTPENVTDIILEKLK